MKRIPMEFAPPLPIWKFQIGSQCKRTGEDLQLFDTDLNIASGSGSFDRTSCKLSRLI